MEINNVMKLNDDETKARLNFIEWKHNIGDNELKRIFDESPTCSKEKVLKCYLCGSDVTKDSKFRCLNCHPNQEKTTNFYWSLLVVVCAFLVYLYILARI